MVQMQPGFGAVRANPNGAALIQLPRDVDGVAGTVATIVGCVKQIVVDVDRGRVLQVQIGAHCRVGVGCRPSVRVDIYVRQDCARDTRLRVARVVNVHRVLVRRGDIRCDHHGLVSWPERPRRVVKQVIVDVHVLNQTGGRVENYPPHDVVVKIVADDTDIGRVRAGVDLHPGMDLRELTVSHGDP